MIGLIILRLYQPVSSGALQLVHGGGVAGALVAGLQIILQIRHAESPGVLAPIALDKQQAARECHAVPCLLGAAKITRRPIAMVVTFARKNPVSHGHD